MSAAVVSTSVIGSAATTIQRGRGSARGQRADLVAERPRVGEDQRRVEAEDHQPGQPLGVRVSSQVVVAGQAGDPAEHRLVGPPGPAEHVEDRQRDRDRDARQHAEQRDAEERGDRERELGPALPPQPARRRRCRRATATRRSRPRRASAAAGCAAGPGTSTSISTIARRADQAGHLGLRAGLLGDRGARAAGADREALEEAGGDVRGADPDHLPVAVDLLAGAGGERRRRGDRVGERDQGDARARRRRAAARSATRRVGRVSGGKPCGSVPTSDTPRSARSNSADRGDRERPRRPGRRGPSAASARSTQDQRQATSADRERGARRCRPSASPARTPRPRRSGRRRRPRTRTAWAAGRPGWSAPGRSCSRSGSAWTAGRRRTRAWRRRRAP